MKAIKENQRNKHECKKRLNQKEKGRPERGTTTWNTEDTQQTQTNNTRKNRKSMEKYHGK